MRARPDELAVELEHEGIQLRSAHWGDMHVGQYTLPAGTDLSPFFAALPGGLCSGDHWGIMTEGELHVRYEDGTVETTRAGELYFWPAGHTAWTDRGAVFLALTPLRQAKHMDEQIAAASAG